MFETIKIGRCIFCGKTDIDLTDEHAIPYGLNGNLVLHEASCKECAKVTSKFEMSCLRELLGTTRAKLNFQTRRPKQITTLLKVDHGNGWKETEINARQFAGLSILPFYEPPGFLMGRVDNEVKLRGWQNLEVGNPSVELSQFIKSPTTKIQLQRKLDVHSFSRMLAKIGYCLAVAHFGLEKVSEAFVLPSIMGKSSDVQTWVGSEDIAYTTRPNSLHFADVFVLNNDIIVSRIGLFAKFGGQPFTVVVGKFKSVT